MKKKKTSKPEMVVGKENSDQIFEDLPPETSGSVTCLGIAKARDRWYVPDPTKSGDLEILRERTLLKEFANYKQEKKKLKVFRLEAVRAGFKRAWQNRDYATIKEIVEKINQATLESDPKLPMWYDQALTRIGGK